VPVEFWKYAIKEVKKKFPDAFAVKVSGDTVVRVN
jgi:hypothetical protein